MFKDEPPGSWALYLAMVDVTINLVMWLSS